MTCGPAWKACPIMLLDARSLLLTHLLVAALSLGAANSAAGQDRWAAADSAVVRLPPSAFPELPRHVRTVLEDRGCGIPQSVYASTPHNIVPGRFFGTEVQAWAVLCSVDFTSSILVFPDDGASQPVELSPSPDRNYLQDFGSEGIVYSRAIDIAGADRIRRLHEEFGGPALPAPIEHDGIEDLFVGKASLVHYWYND